MVVVVAVGGFLLGILIAMKFGENRLMRAKSQAEKLIKEAELEVERKRKEIELEVKDRFIQSKVKFERDTETTKRELERYQRKLREKEKNIDRKAELLSRREGDLVKREKEQALKEKSLVSKEERLNHLIGEENMKLEKIARMTTQEAKRQLMANLESEVRHEAAQMIKEIRDKAKEQAKKEAREIIVSAIQRCAVEHVGESTVTLVGLPNDEMKGRIIGREGRNIRAFETATGVEVTVDDTPGAVTLSSFDPIRREVAKIALEKLMEDGRIQPARIEEVVKKAEEELEETIKRLGEETVLDVGLPGVHSELMKLIGKMNYRTSYGQNVLQHSKEVAFIAGLMAGQLDLDVPLAKRCGLLHDIGKVLDQSYEGTHARIGAEICEKYGESTEVVNAVASHHEEVESKSLYAVLVQAADAISGSRPGARRETLEAYIKRLVKLEDIANSFTGIERAYAIQAGREIRIMVEPSSVDDVRAVQLASEIASRIEGELKYPGQIKVTVIRETRAIDYAK
ncbi:ribonuclease [candidate division TA06 bacterium DG_26]|uniref:Ribonuclease Y n=1 Tax=candidate division TA06 bacterium DG_26 TaxID=1703771 RepID=A0A0S7WJN7_UNCT6|nr:MAG: ribonuclease [candidate division TA06 bacterium DG_26]